MPKKISYLAALLSIVILPGYAEDQTVVELEPITVTAPLQDNPSDNAVPTTILNGDELRMKVGHSIGETLKNELGITSQSFGPGVGTPVIRGQAGSRVRVLNNGIGSNDASTLSPDHATSVEPLLAERIEVLRGPATLQYGSGAIGGIVNVIDNRIPNLMPDKLLGGALEQRLDSTSDETSTTMKLEGGKSNIAYHLDGFYRNRNNLAIGGNGIDTAAVAVTDPSIKVVDNPKGILSNTSAEAISGSAGLSWLVEPGFAGASINRLDNNYGIAPDGQGLKTTRILLRQNKYDFKSELKHPFHFAKKLSARLGYTDYQHTEVTNGQPGAFFTNKTYEGRLELTHQDLGPLQGKVGFQAQSSDFNAIDKSTGTAIVPRSDINSYAMFAVESFAISKVKYQLGLRVEHTGINPDGFASLGYTPVSASASASWKLDGQNSLNLALTRSSRAPNVQELLADGFHDATRSFEVGNINLKEENTYNLDLGYRFKSDWLRAEFDLFHNWANNYITQQRSGRFVDQNGNPCITNCVPFAITTQGDAIFKGYEAKLILNLMENKQGFLDITLFSDYTRGQFDNGSNVPRMPPLRYGLQLDYGLGDLTSYLRFTRAEAQTYAGNFDTPTGGYFLLNLGTQYKVKTYKDAELMLFAKANNLLDENIRNSTSYLRNFAPEAGRGAEVGFRVSY
jgi:iron complex outermembrane receptor protein